jgi:ferredoxin
VQVTIDSATCQGHGRCSLLVPDVFGVDDDGMGHVLAPDVPAAMEDDVRKAAATCPERAIAFGA